MRLTAVSVAVVTLACALSACSGGPEAPTISAPEKSPSVSATPEPTSEPSPTEKPAASPSPTDKVVQTGGSDIDPATKASATAFVRGVLKALDKGATTGDFSDALRTFDSSCQSCKQGIAYAQGIYAKNQKIVGGQYQDPKFSVGSSPVADVVVRVDSTVAAYKVVDAAGKTIGRAGAEPDVSNYHLKKSGAAWHVVRWSYS